MWQARGVPMLPRMIARTLALCAAVALLAGPAAPAASAPVDSATVAATIDAATIDGAVREYLDATGLPGAAVAVTRGSEVVHAAGYGRTPAGAPVTEHTPMAVASVSKSFTALAVMQLVEAGRVVLAGKVRTYLPEFTMADPRAGEITVRQLLDQTSGMSDTELRSFSAPTASSLRETVAGMHSARLAAAPGTRWEYHNPNFQVAARLVEVVGGRPFADHLQEHVFGPLGMADSFTVDTADDLPATGVGHVMVLGWPVAAAEPRGYGNGSGGVLSSAHDMAAWLIAQGNSGRGPDGTAIASAASIGAMHTPSAVSGSYGLGWFVDTTASGARVIEHGGDLVTATAYQGLLPASGYGVAVMANTGALHADAQAIANRLIAVIEGRPAPLPGTPLLLVDAVLLALAAGAALLTGRGVLRSRRWAADRPLRPRTAARLIPLLAPIVLFAAVHRIVGLLYRGRDFAWIQMPYLYPTFMLLLATATLGCTAVLVARIGGLAAATRRRRT